MALVKSGTESRGVSSAPVETTELLKHKAAEETPSFILTETTNWSCVWTLTLNRAGSELSIHTHASAHTHSVVYMNTMNFTASEIRNIS